MTSPAQDPVPERTTAPDDRLFFAERLPAGPESESPAETEARVLLDLETSSPLAIDKLAYGWVRLPSKDILYYAAPRERVPPHDAFASAGTVLPPAGAVVLPDDVPAADFLRASRDFYADLRPRADLAEMRVRARADSLLSKLSLPLKLITVACVLLLGAGATVSGMNAATRRRIDGGAKDVKEAQTRADMLSTIDRMEAAGHSVFDALAVLNPARPEGVHFTRVAFSTGRELALDGDADNAGLVTRLESALRTTGFFSAFGQPNIQTSGGRTKFQMRLSFRQWPEITDAATAAGEAEITSPTEISAPAASGVRDAGSRDAGRERGARGTRGTGTGTSRGRFRQGGVQ